MAREGLGWGVPSLNMKIIRVVTVAETGGASQCTSIKVPCKLIFRCNPFFRILFFEKKTSQDPRFSTKELSEKKHETNKNQVIESLRRKIWKAPPLEEDEAVMVPCFTNCPSELGELSGLEVSPFGS